MAWQSWLGLVIMVLGFAGVLAAAKMHKEPIAIVCAIVMLAGLGVYGWFYFNPPPDTSYQTYGKAVAQKIGEEVKKASPSKAVWVTADGSSELAKEYVEIFKKAAGCEVEVVALMDGEGGMGELNDKKLAEILKGRAATEAVVLDTTFMGDLKKVEFFKKSYKGPKIFMTNNASMVGAGEKQFKTAFDSGNIVAAVASLSDVEKDFKPSDSDLEEAFTKRYVIVNKDNFDSNKANMGFAE